MEGVERVMVKASEALSARARARQAKAELDAQRVERDRLIVDATTAFYEADESLAKARAAAEMAEQQRAATVGQLFDLRQTEAEVATLCGLGIKEVRELRRKAAATKQSSATDADDPSASDSAAAAVDSASAAA